MNPLEGLFGFGGTCHGGLQLLGCQRDAKGTLCPPAWSFYQLAVLSWQAMIQDWVGTVDPRGHFSRLLAHTHTPKLGLCVLQAKARGSFLIPLAIEGKRFSGAAHVPRLAILPL